MNLLANEKDEWVIWCIPEECWLKIWIGLKTQLSPWVACIKNWVQISKSISNTWVILFSTKINKRHSINNHLCVQALNKEKEVVHIKEAKKKMLLLKHKVKDSWLPRNNSMCKCNNNNKYLHSNSSSCSIQTRKTTWVLAQARWISRWIQVKHCLSILTNTKTNLAREIKTS